MFNCLRLRVRLITVTVILIVVTAGCADNGSVAASRPPEPAPVVNLEPTPFPTPTPYPTPSPEPTPTPIPEPTAVPTPTPTVTTTPPALAPTPEPPRRPHRPHHRPTPTPSPSPTPAPEPVEVSVIDLPPLSVSHPDWFVTNGTSRSNAIWLNPRGAEELSGTFVNSVTYWLGMHADRLRATLTPPPHDGLREVRLIYRVHGYFPDGSSRPLFTSSQMTHVSAPIPIDVNVRGVLNLRLELEVSFIGDQAPGFTSQGFPGGYRGIENAVILTTYR